MNCYKKSSYYYYHKENNLNVEEVIQDILNIENSGIEKSKEEEIKYYENSLKSVDNIFTSE